MRRPATERRYRELLLLRRERTKRDLGTRAARRRRAFGHSFRRISLTSFLSSSWRHRGMRNSRATSAGVIGRSVIRIGACFTSQSSPCVRGKSTSSMRDGGLDHAGVAQALARGGVVAELGEDLVVVLADERRGAIDGARSLRQM